MGSLVHQKTGTVLAPQATIAEGFFPQLIGWMGKQTLRPDAALGIGSCNWVHTFFIALPLDLVYCDRDGRILRVVRAVAPNRLAPWVLGATMVWEMVAGRIPETVVPGDVLEFQETLQ
jgi:hypothetical protein